MKASEEHKAGRIKGNNNIAFRYDPFTENDVLAITNTYKAVFILLKNGNIFTFNGENSDKNKLNSRVARPLKTPTKIIDLACGHDHCLARGSNYAVYSWGSNDSGQLGLSNFNASFSRKEEPTEISILSTSYRINRVYARNNTSYAVSESNNLIGWGSNKNGEIDPAGDNIVKIPTLIQTYNKDFTIINCNKEAKLYRGEFEETGFEISEIVELNKNKTLYSQDYELRADIDKKTKELSQMRKIRINIKDYEDFIKDVEEIIVYKKDKIYNIELRNNNKNDANSNKLYIPYDKQMEYFADKRVVYGKKKAFDNLISEEEKSKLKFYGNLNSVTKPEELAENEVELKKKQNLKLGVFYDKVNQELKFQNFSKVNTNLKEGEAIKIQEKKKKRILDTISIFESVITETQKLIERKNEKDMMKNLFQLLDELKSEYPNFQMNNLDRITETRGNTDSLLQILNKSAKNLDKLEEKISNMIWNKQMGNVQTVIKIFQRNTKIAKENHHLIKLISKFSNNYYSSLFDNIVVNDNPDNFDEMKTRIEKIKEFIPTTTTQVINDEEEDYYRGVYSDSSFD